MGKRQRQKGHRFELRAIQSLRRAFPQAVSARSESRSADARGVDIVNTPGFAFQCKSLSRSVNYRKLFDQIDTQDIPVILHELTEKANVNFVVRGRYAILHMEDLIELLCRMRKT